MKRFVAYIITVVLSAASISAGGEPFVQRVTLEEAVQSALQHNHDLVAAKLEVEKAEARVREARGYALPSIDVTGRYSRALKKPVFFFPNVFAEDSTKRGEIIPLQIGADHSFDITVSATQVLFNSAVFVGVGAAKIYAQAARESYRTKELEAVTNARKAFYGVLVAGEVRDMMLSNLQNAEENLRNVRRLAEQGLVSEYDQLRADVGVGNLRPEIIRAENNYTLALNGLKIAMGLPFDREMEIVGSLEFRPVDEGIVARALETTLEQNPALAALRSQADVNDAIISAERSSYLPTLAAFGSYQYQAQRNDMRFSTGDFISSSLVGVSLSMNIFSGFRSQARVEQAELDFRKAQEQIAGAETTLKTVVQSTVLQLRRSQQRIEAQQRTVEQAEKGYRIATTRFTSGSGTQLEVNDAQLALTQAKVNRIQAVYDYLAASSELDQLTGQLPEYARHDR